VVNTHVDHFIPWSRYPVDLGHNFVAAHASCNSKKSDRLAAERHLDRWVGMVDGGGDDLAAEFSRLRVQSDLPSSLKITRWAYQQTFDAGGLTWLKGNELLALGAGWEASLEQLMRQ
jgi:hypothetical protein